MANLRTAMDAAFWDLNISTPQALDGVARAVPGDPIPLDGSRASRALRIQQVSLLGNGFPLGIIPSFSPSPNHKESGSFALQSLLGKAAFENWWVGLIGQFRPKKLISSIKAEVSAAEEWELPLLKDVAKHFLDKSLYAIGLCSQIALTSTSSLLLSSEKHGLRYRFGLHKNSGLPQAVDSINAPTPLALLPGLCAKAAFSYEKSKDLWRQKERKEDNTVETEKGQFSLPSYDIRLKEPHAAISGIIGGTCEAWLSGGNGSQSVDPSQNTKDRGRFGADLFGSVCYTYQHGKFRNSFGDLTRIDSRLDIGSASALAKKFSNLFRSAQSNGPQNELSSPRLNLIFQQQVAGPIVFRVDSKFSLDSSSGRHGPQLEDLICSLNYSLRLLRSGKVVAWYSRSETRE
ncbi:hypothetical protein DH2020_048496 [Rehmannia glutinosa]|uniref:Protein TRIGALACTOSYLDIACYLGLYCEROL 4, chloroplastic n=1 Tax=Rehmannia glutinosa TaxID=99300 RepID=A0ABR0U5U4_REHGL